MGAFPQAFGSLKQVGRGIMNYSLHRLLIATAALLSSALAQAEISVVVNPDHPLASLTTEQIAAIYLGKDKRFQPIDLPESERLHHWFYYKTTGRDATPMRSDVSQRINGPSPMSIAARSILRSRSS
jgi:hypothetical protein